MGMTQAEAIAERIKGEAKRLYGPILVRVSLDAYPNDDGADIYMYAPRKYSDMLLTKLKAAREQFLKGTKVDRDKLRLFMEDSENMSPELKAKLMAQAQAPQPPQK
ncbi:MAG: hypothetical protein LLG37_05565 [Spirochaetia bacterium]|nr:hypothetical protein [Spirochaetia bacterium]